MKPIWRFTALLLVVLSSSSVLLWPTRNAAAPRQQAEVSAPVTPGVSQPVTSLPVAPVPEEVLITEFNPRQPPLVAEEATDRMAAEARTADPLLATAQAEGNTPAALLSFDGLGNAGPIPPDTMGEVGPQHYVQMVNVRFAIYDKTGVLLTGPHNFNTLFSGRGGQCERQNDGDPVVVYDRLADRWLLTQFAKPSHMCLALSQTNDPTGAYFLYEFNVGAFPDYFKFGVWPDGYYMSANERTYTAYVFDRVRMLTGAAATFQKFTGETNFLMPSHFTGATPPPAGTPNIFYTFKDETFHAGGPDRLELFEFHVDWATPANSTFARALTLPIASFNYTVCGFFELACIAQPTPGEKVDAVSEWPMWRFQYRNFGDYETLVGNFTVEVDGAQHAGIRWFELRRASGGSWALHQEGTHAPDANHRWLGSIGMDGDGNLGLGYSVTGPNLNAGIGFATRLASDAVGALQAEVALQAGGGVQTNGFHRWGDYSSLSVDPADDCTFWYTNQYYVATSPGNWQTRVGVFRIPSCGMQQPVEPARFEYAAKLVCGLQRDPEDIRLARGLYATTINIHNPNAGEVKLRKKLALTIPPGSQKAGEIFEIAEDVLAPDQALAADCMDIRERVFNGAFPAPYIEGFVIIQSQESLDVVAVYTTAALDEGGQVTSHSSIDVEQIRERDKAGANLPDLIVQDINLDALTVDCPGGGGTCVTKGEFTVANVGAGPASAFAMRSTLDPGQAVVVNTNEPAGLNAGAANLYTILTPAGGNCFDPDCTICVTVDSAAAVAESDESNNMMCVTKPG